MKPAAAKRPQVVDAAHAKRKKPRRGVRRSKAERLAKRQVEVSAASSADVAEVATTVEQLQSASCSPEWEALLPTLTTTDAGCAFVRMLLWSKRLPKAAAHYVQRLPLLTPELVLRLAQERPQPTEADEDGKPPSTALLVAQFLLDLPLELLATRSRLEAFLWPWLTTESESAGPASHLLLQLPPPTISGERKALVRRREQTLELQRALVQQCLVQGQLLYLVPQYVSAFQHQLQQHPALQAPAPAPAAPSDGSSTSLVALQVAQRMQTLLRMIWADARVLVFGSSATGLRQDGQEDLDLCVLLPSSPLAGQAAASLIEDMKEHLALYLGPQTTITAVTGARVPIVHFVDPESRLSCDLCVNNMAALWNTQLLRWLVHEASPVHSDAIVALAKWLKHWRRAKQRVFGGSLSSYGLLLLLLYFLQRKRILPGVDMASLHAQDADLTTVDYDAMYQQVATQAAKQQSQSKEEGEAQPTPWTQWLVQFFQFYAMEFDFEHDVVSLRGQLTKQDKQWTRKAWTTALSIEDPIELQRDLGTLFHRRSLAKLRCAIAHACVQLSDPATRSLDDLLRTFPYEQPVAPELEEEAGAGEE